MASRDHDPATCAATPKSAAPEAAWQSTLQPPTHPGRIVMLYDDGSGGCLYYHAGDGVLFDGEDGCEYEWAERDNMSFWAYLPTGFRLWIETREEDPLTFPAPDGSATSRAALSTPEAK